MATIIPSTQALGVAIRNARRRLRLTQTELAERTSLTQATVSNIERGVSSPGIDTVLRLMGVLGLELQVQVRPPEDPKAPWEDD